MATSAALVEAPRAPVSDLPSRWNATITMGRGMGEEVDGRESAQ